MAPRAVLLLQQALCVLPIVLLHVLPRAAGHLQLECAARCPFQNKTDDGLLDTAGCGGDCRIEQCGLGCRSWQDALQTSCQTVCNGTQELLPPKELYCVMGCNDAVNMYFQRLKEEIGVPPAPALVADSLTSHSLSLEWDGLESVDGSRFANLSYLVQWRYEELAAAWQYCRNQSWGPHATAHVDNLQPYSKYRFRVALLLPGGHSGGELVVSAPSVVISTLASGVPSSPPTITRATAVDWGRVSVSWTPGRFPNGPLLSYVLHIVELPAGYSALKDIPASESADFYMFQNLLPGRNYSVSVAMRNGVGEGPAASAVLSTPPQPEPAAPEDKKQPALVLAASRTVTRQAADLLDEPAVLYHAKGSHTITGLALHVAKRLLFVSDSGGVVWRASLDGDGGPGGEVAILSPAQSRVLPQALSVDWLNDLVYLVGQVVQDGDVAPTWQVARASLDGRGLTVAVAGLPSKPLHVQVDPYNGFLFWVLGGDRGGGLYRLDLAEVSNGIKHETRPSVLLEDPHLGAFVVDHANFRLLVPHHANNTVLSVSLDGREVADLRRNTQQAMFRHVVSLAVAGGLFYWTNGREVLTEEYHAGQDAYFHNTYPNTADRSFVSVCVDGAAAQPVPVPVNPPTAVQAVLGAALAKASWQAPHLLGGQGRGAWQDWSYVLSVRDEESGDTLEHRDVNATWCTVHGLREDTPYVVKAAAYTSAGVGPWSGEFRARTLRSHPPPATVLWSAAGGLLRSDVTADRVELLLHAGSLRDGRSASPFHAAALASWRDRVYLVANTSRVYMYNLTSRELARLPHLDSVGSVAVDWIGQRLYWSNPKQQLITRGNLLGGQQEPLPILTVAKELLVDASHAFLYWSTGHGVESARLNGKGRRTYYPAELFSGKHVMGLTLARDSQSLYWVVRSYEGSALFRAPMADQLQLQPGEAVEPEQVSQLYAGMQGPLCYFSHHLLWLQDDRNAVIGDLAGQNAAVIGGGGSTSLSHLHSVAVQDPDQQRVPVPELDVIPKAVAQSSIRVTGSWEAFNISWNPVTNVNYGQVFYEVKVRDGTGKEMSQETLHCSVRCCGGQASPYTELDVTVRALTYWGASPAVRARLHSPAARPREPHNPRVFVTYRAGRRTHGAGQGRNITALFRWDPPRQPNGPVHKYLVKHWYSRPVGDLHMCEPVTLPADKLEYEATLLEHNCTYYFQVQAFTEAGSGAPSAPVSANTGVERPVPRLLLATVHALVLEDCDRRAETTLLRAAATPVDLAFLHAKASPGEPRAAQDKVVWISETQEIRVATLDGRNKTKLAALTGSALSVAVDWVGRVVFWSELDEGAGGVASVVRKLYLDRDDATTPVTILRREGVVRQIAVAPLNSTLVWVEDGTLMTSDHDGAGARRFFSRAPTVAGGASPERRRRACTCPASPRAGPALAMDHSDAGRPRVLWVDATEGRGDVVAADLDACACSVLVSARALREAGLEAGLPASAVTADGERVYWANASLGRVYSAPKAVGHTAVPPPPGLHGPQGAQTSHGLTARELSGVRRIAALGPHLQPYPADHCLVPRQPAGTATLVARNSSSVRLRLPPPQRPPPCAGTSLAPAASTLHHGRPHDCGRDRERCRVLVTYDSEVDVTGLEPYTEYVFMVSQANFYTAAQDVVPGPPAVFQTAPGAPTPPRDVRLRAEDPTTVRVWWRSPERLHARAVWYELHWRAEGAGPGARTSGQDVVPDQGGKDLHTATLAKLTPGQGYAIWVRAHAGSSELTTQPGDAVDAYTDSAVALVRTLPEPGPLTLLAATPYSLAVSWTAMPADALLQSCALQYCASGTAACRTVAVHLQQPSAPAHVLVQGLQPKTNYTLRLAMTFPHSTQTFLWPGDARFTFQTHGDRPSPPGTPVIQHLYRAVYQVTWQPSDPNGAPVEAYTLQGWVRRRPPPPQGDEGDKSQAPQWAPRRRRQAEAATGVEAQPQWDTFYNGSDNFWIMSELGAGALAGAQYVFRVRALNEHGWSNWSAESRSFDLSEAALLADQQELGVVLGIAIPGVLAFCFVAALVFLCVNRRREQEKKALQASGAVGVATGGGVGGVLGGVGGHGALDVELATLRELPRRGNFIHRTNTLYSAYPAGGPQDGPTDEEVALLPHIRRHQITLTKFLGSGAFGEVFEGNARDLPEGQGVMRVAIKTLRKGATELEKAEFLKEAQLMSHFKHAHILQLLGVCLDNDPNFIIMELMEGGDLLSYLRCRRPAANAGSGLSLQDLLGMCVDVARGCRYLEEMHFVHRDLACRNCLVSSLEGLDGLDTPGNGRVVKIGDFGLARDIYKNDYYRKEGEGLLPVRWMAPESLMDGVFTCQSDVWAFGVLVWEVMTLGQQPYPARTNIEVLHYVRGGGRLGRPSNCPEDLHQLMLKCWLYSPESRPTFKYCLQILEDLKAKSQSLPVPPLNLVNGGVANRGYFEDENHNSSGDSWKTGSDGGSRDRVPFLAGNPAVPQTIPKYLELIYDGEGQGEGRPGDGYEVPVGMPRRASEYSNLPPCQDTSLTPGTS